MNQLNEEIRVIQTQISYLEDKLYHSKNLMSGEQNQKHNRQNN